MKVENHYTVYMHITPSGKVYIGLTSTSVEKRWKNGKGYKTNQPFWNAIQKYGWENIEHKIIAEGLTYEEAGEMEKAYIKKYNATNNKYGYNICFGGEDGWVGVHHTEETKRKISEAKKGKVYRKGYHFSEESKKKMSESHKGKYHGKPVKPKPPKRPKRGFTISDEHKKRISEANTGIYRSPEVRANMSKAQIKTKKPVRCIDTGEVFESQTEAMKHFNIDKTLIGRACKGKQKTAKGLRFEYV